jgi:hypothetical protein
MLLLKPDGRLALRDAAADIEDKEREARLREVKKRIREVKEKGKTGAGAGRPFDGN